MALRQIENQFHGRLRSMVEQAYLPPFPPLPVIRERNWEEITKKTRHRKSCPIFHDRPTGQLYNLQSPDWLLNEKQFYLFSNEFCFVTKNNYRSFEHMLSPNSVNQSRLTALEFVTQLLLSPFLSFYPRRKPIFLPSFLPFFVVYSQCPLNDPSTRGNNSC